MTKFEKLNFTNDNNFDILLIKQCDINSISWTDPNYLDKIINLDIYNIINTNNNNFLEDITEHLEINKHNEFSNLQIHTQVIAEFPTYIFELLFFICFDKTNKIKQEKEIFNGVASLLNTSEDQIFGNAILFKTYLPQSSLEMKIHDIKKDDIKEILYNRVNTSVVTYDDDTLWNQINVIGDMESFAKNFFDDENFIKIEIPFLLHNINIWYEKPFKNPTTKSSVCGNIIKNSICKCIWFTMISDEYRGSITLDEVQKIIKLSYHMELPYKPKEEWMCDEFDKDKRKLIKNKYRVLDFAYNYFFSNVV
jgi:hypothetical protein